MHICIRRWNGLLRVFTVDNSRERGIGFLGPYWKDKRRRNERHKRTKEEQELEGICFCTVNTGVFSFFFFLVALTAASTPSRRFVQPNSLTPDGAGNRNQNLLTSRENCPERGRGVEPGTSYIHTSRCVGGIIIYPSTLNSHVLRLAWSITESTRRQSDY